MFNVHNLPWPETQHEPHAIFWSHYFEEISNISKNFTYGGIMTVCGPCLDAPFLQNVFPSLEYLELPDFSID